MTDSIPYQVIAKAVSPSLKSYHTVEILYGKAVVTFHLSGAASERNVNFYKLMHEEQIQEEIKDKLKKQSLPKLPKAPIVTPQPKQVTTAPSIPKTGTLVKKTIFCSKCKHFKFKGYLQADGTYLCHDCKCLAKNPHPKPRIVYQPLEGGKRR